jgi:hypothetical protein
MVDGDVELAEAVTHTRIAVPQHDGSIIIDHILESLDQSTSKIDQEVPLAERDGNYEVPFGEHNNNYEEMNVSVPPSPVPKRSKVIVSFFIILGLTNLYH